MKAFDQARWLRISGYLDQALDLAPHARREYVEAIRQSDPDAATDVGAMLDQHRQLNEAGFLDTAPLKPVEPSLTGVTIGAYQLVSPIGHGGMGSVWLAERSDGRFEGQVAVKLLNAALVGRGGEERFRREGTILARLAHPHIARLIDAGVSNTGQPYLVLELVQGRHIDEHCNDNKLSIEQRLRLFLDVQSAVAHAHANLIVHRDLKPSNVLVDAEGSVKLLDFSIAKLIDDEGVSRLTREVGSALTPKYAAPEQVTAGTITTATDVYAMGVLLFELLSGEHPCGSEPKTPAEFGTAIAERESLRLSVAARQAIDLEARAGQRATTPDRLVRSLRGDLDTIVAKALKKTPEERYGSVVEFADDLRRHLDHQPISARPDAMGYRAAKFVRRHSRPVISAATAILALLTLVGFYTKQLGDERDRARLQAEKASRISELLAGVLTSVDPYRTPGASEPTVRNLLDDAAARITGELGDQPELQAEMLTVIGRTYERLGINDKALPLLEQALAIGRRTFGNEHERVGQSLNALGVLHHEMGNEEAAEPLLRESLAIRRRVLGPEHADVAVTLVELARVMKGRGNVAESEAPIREALAIRSKIFGEEHRETATSKAELGLLLWDRGDLAGAEPLFRENVATSERVLGSDHPNVGAGKSSLGMLLTAKGDPVAGEKMLREAVRIRRRVFGPTHAEYALALPNLALALEGQGKLAEAQTLLEEAQRLATAQMGDDHPRVVSASLDLVRVRIARGQTAGIENEVRDALAVRERLYRAGDWRIGQAQSLLAAALLARKRYAEAEPLMQAADRSLKPAPGRQGLERLANRGRLIALYEAQGKTALASSYR